MSSNPERLRRRGSAANRRRSNELSASLRIEQLRSLQSQLSVMIVDAKDSKYTPVAGDDDEVSLGSTSSRGSRASVRTTATSSSFAGSTTTTTTRLPAGNGSGSSSLGKDNDNNGVGNSERTLPSANKGGDDDGYDLESGLLPPTFKPGLNTVYHPAKQRQSPLTPSFNASDDTLLVTHRVGSGGGLKPSIMKSYPSTVGRASSMAESEVSMDDTKSNISGVSGGETGSMFSSGTNNGNNGGLRNSTDNKSLDGSESSRKSRWARSRDGARSISRSIRDRSRSGSRGRVLKARQDKGAGVNVSASTRSASTLVGGMGKSLRMLPNYDFLGKDIEEEDKEEGSLRPGAKWWHAVFLFSIISMLACIITLWAPYPIGARMPTDMIADMPWSTGCKNGLQSCICPRETICADDLMSMIFLTIARSTAWFDYPLYMLLFMSKANNLNNFLQKTALRCWINFSDYHKVHSLFGVIVGLEATSHSFFHILRWARRSDDIQLLWTSRTGITGLTAIILTPFIVLPMTVPYLKKRLSFEWRKGLHYFSIIWGVALMCHAPQRIFWLIGIPFFIYMADKMVEGLFKTHLVESCHFQRLGDTSCIISFENPPGFGKQNSAYVYLMLPWLSKYQFHAFTVFPSNKHNHSSICIHKCGNWTQKLMKTILTPTHKPAFVVGPFLSPFSSPAMDSENLVAVASGIGVTPAISLIKQYSSTSRRLNLVWICRDPGLVEHFLQNVEFGSDGYTLIYYTGKERSIILRDELPSNVFIFNGRPNLERTLSGIISSIATGEGLPEELSNKVLTRTPAEMRSKLLLEKALSIYTLDQLYDYTVKASNHYNEGLEPLVNVVNYQGVLSSMRHLLGDDIEDVTDKITTNFEKIDTDGDCRLERNEFEQFFNLMLVVNDDDTQEVSNVRMGLQRMNTARNMFESSKGSSTKLQDDVFDIKRHLQGDGKFAANKWNMLYCGGSQPVLDQLKDFKRKFGIGLSVEKFDW